MCRAPFWYWWIFTASWATDSRQNSTNSSRCMRESDRATATILDWGGVTEGVRGGEAGRGWGFGLDGCLSEVTLWGSHRATTRRGGNGWDRVSQKKRLPHHHLSTPTHRRLPPQQQVAGRLLPRLKRAAAAAALAVADIVHPAPLHSRRRGRRSRRHRAVPLSAAAGAAHALPAGAPRVRTIAPLAPHHGVQRPHLHLELPQRRLHV